MRGVLGWLMAVVTLGVGFWFGMFLSKRFGRGAAGA